MKKDWKWLKEVESRFDLPGDQFFMPGEIRPLIQAIHFMREALGFYSEPESLPAWKYNNPQERNPNEPGIIVNSGAINIRGMDGGQIAREVLEKCAQGEFE